ncbi:hypothetical protein N825_07820 [Skermanella stibiiresistens SB22]|uniref:Thioesterase domain-containing protein n=1 Tax=Skermanella stibiiresistens SB22 TaxID=1385369 RepID=W9H3D4_9PROT|nr:PaaI family thioesterase [Skermanella stibiiresistens]EWY39227.1 hypothetical protein N825_07820 [Skermanella stibiiresistens SB22]
MTAPPSLDQDEPFTDPLLSAEEPSGFQRTMRYQLAEWRPDEAVLTLDVLPRHLNRNGVVHGGVLATLIDTVGGFAGTYCTVPGNKRGAVTLSLTTTFMAQASGGTLRAVARRRGGGRKIFMVTCEIFAGDTLVAMGEGTYRYRAGSENPEGVPRA